MSYSIKTILRTKKINPKGESPVFVRIIHGKDSYYVSLKATATENNWDDLLGLPRKNHPKFIELKSKITRINHSIHLFIENQKANNEIITAKDIQLKIKDLLDIRQRSKLKLLEFFDVRIKELFEQDRIGYGNTFKESRRSLQRFLNGIDIYMEDINLKFLKDYEIHLEARGNSLNTKSVFFRTFRTLYREAQSRNLISKEKYPFKEFSFSAFNNVKTKKRAITKAEIDAIKVLHLEKESFLNRAKLLFLFSYYSRGMNFIDMASLTQNNIIDNRIEYKRKKTKEDFSILYSDDLKRIVKELSVFKNELHGDYLLPIFNITHEKEESKKYRIAKVIKETNRDLKKIAEVAKINKPITTYSARHTFATVLKRQGTAVEIISELLGHNDTKTTRIYLDSFDNEVLDEITLKNL
jgi:integrase/recombinase XerD